MDERSQAYLEAALKHNWITAPQAEEARRIAETVAEVGIDQKIDDILVKKGFLTPERARKISRELSKRKAPSILTPHPGEMARLLRTATAEVQANRIGAVRRAAELFGSIVILKGHQTLIGDPAGEVWVNPTGNPGMATAGSGDVLTGMIGACLAQGVDPLRAAWLAVFVHGLAGDLAAEANGQVSLVAGDLVASLPEVFVSLERAPD